MADEAVICGPELKDMLYDEVVALLCLDWSEGTHDKTRQLLLALLSSKHASSNSTYVEKLQAIVNDFLCDGADIIVDVPSAVEESPEIVWRLSDFCWGSEALQWQTTDHWDARTCS